MQDRVRIEIAEWPVCDAPSSIDQMEMYVPPQFFRISEILACVRPSGTYTYKSNPPFRTCQSTQAACLRPNIRASLNPSVLSRSPNIGCIRLP